MAKVKNGLSGQFSGRVGNIVGYISRRKNYMRSRAKHYRDAASSQQLVNRQKFTAINKLASSLRGYPCIRSLEQSECSNNNGACFMKYNYAALGDDGNINDFSKLVFSKGKLQFPSHFEIVSDAENNISSCTSEVNISANSKAKDNKGNTTINIRWRNNSLFSDPKSDYLTRELLAFCVLIDSHNKSVRFKYYPLLAQRSEQKASLYLENYKLNEYPMGTSLHFYFFFSDDKQLNFSPSTYIHYSLK